jgi:hypothetical protein
MLCCEMEGQCAGESVPSVSPVLGEPPQQKVGTGQVGALGKWAARQAPRAFLTGGTGRYGR